MMPLLANYTFRFARQLILSATDIRSITPSSRWGIGPALITRNATWV